jgi:hypothetical protein
MYGREKDYQMGIKKTYFDGSAFYVSTRTRLKSSIKLSYQY